ncbi:unnamed protein product [Miscanthus lutarioriparius]|uniref:Uncharacterized protein n=1 Tax=Miscanthus lutarioriparius TaxID=422564 RepID=A0A811MFG9_9POAL|nr:unnamed protein product [Miscanthus lutarioriparius]
MASAGSGTRATAAALLFSFSAILFVLLLLQAPAAPGLAAADLLLLVSALDRLLDGRGLLEVLATRRNMILLCHAILLLILRDAGVLGTPDRRRSRSGCPPGEATAAVAAGGTEIIACSANPARPHATRSAVVAQTACSAVPVPARPHATRSAVVWRRRPRNRAAEPMHDGAAAARRLVECQPAVESPRNDEDLLDRHDRTAIVEQVEHPTAIAVDGVRDCDDRSVIAVANDEKLVYTAREQQMAGMEMELADDRTFEEFIKSQRRKMRQESLHYQAIAACD